MVINLYAKNIKHYYFWNSVVVPTNLKIMQDAIRNKRGGGGNTTSEVAKTVVDKKYYNMILITDGEVGDYDVRACDKILEQAKKEKVFKINKAVCYVIMAYSEPNMSITCPFTRYSESKVFSKKGEEPMKTMIQYSAEDFKIMEGLEDISLENFEEKY